MEGGGFFSQILQDKNEALKPLAKEFDTVFKNVLEEFPNEEPFINNIPGFITILEQMKPDAYGVLHLDENNPKIKFVIHEILLTMEDLIKVDPLNFYIFRFVHQNHNILDKFVEDIKVIFDIKLNVEGELKLQEIVAAIQNIMKKFEGADIFPDVSDKTELQDVFAYCTHKWENAAEVQCPEYMDLLFLDNAVLYLEDQVTAPPRKKRDVKTEKCEELWPYIGKLVCAESPTSDLRFPPGHSFWD